MKSIVSLVAISLAFFFHQTAANIVAEPLPDVLYIGHDYTIRWNGTAVYVYDLWLDIQTPTEGAPRPFQIQPIATSIKPISPSLSASYTWTVPANISTHGSYGIWIEGVNHTYQFAGESEFVDSGTTNWFNIADAPGPSSSSTSTGTSAGPAVTTHAATSSPSSTSSTSPSTHHTSISGGAIAGIVIGVLALIAIAIGAIIFVGWRRRRSAKQSREAEARANRLAPIVDKEANTFEMRSPMSQAV